MWVSVTNERHFIINIHVNIVGRLTENRINQIVLFFANTHETSGDAEFLPVDISRKEVFLSTQTQVMELCMPLCIVT